MRNVITLAFAVFLFSCNQSDSKKTDQQIDSSKKGQSIDSPKKNIDSTATKTAAPLSVMDMANEIMMAAKAKDYQKFASFVHPEKGVRFSPYSNIDKVGDKRFTGDSLVKLANSKKKIDWGSGWAEPEKLTVEGYFAQCVYDRDYLKEGKKSLNNMHRGGSAEIINVDQIYARHDIVEYFFQSTKKDGELDWSAVRLVFETKDNTPYLIAMVYDHWTP